MSFVIYFLTAVLLLVCLLIVLLVLVQLPKKEAGMGQAFGGAATDALFGAGSGNVLTKVTKWGAGIFFALAITITILGNYMTNSGGGGGRLQRQLGEAKAPVPVAPPAPAASVTVDAPKSNVLDIKLPPAAPVVPAVPAVPAPAK